MKAGLGKAIRGNGKGKLLVQEQRKRWVETETNN